MKLALSLGATLAVLGLITLAPVEDAQAKTDDPPGIVLIQLDDASKADLEYMPKTRTVLQSQGTTFSNSYTPVSVCCPSRASLLRGQYAHNHGVVTSHEPNGGYERWKELGLGKSNIATWLDDAGYQTVHLGKYLNGYADSGVPPGWDFWNTYYGAFHIENRINNNGKVHTYPDRAVLDFISTRKAEYYIDRLSKNDAPMYLQMDLFAPHGPPQHPDSYDKFYRGETAPRKPSTNESDVSDKPRWVRGRDKFNMQAVDSRYRDRLRDLKMADEAVGRTVRALRESGELRNTYIIFTSDNGYQLGEHRLFGKWTGYEESIRVPTIVRGPGVPKGVTRDEMIVNNDWGPTFAELGGAKAPAFVDGTSIAPLLRGEHPKWRNRIMLESYRRNDTISSPAPTFNGVRSINFKWLKYYEGPNPTGDIAGRELYAFNRDPYELNSIHRTAPQNLRGTLERWRRQLEDCSGDSCSDAEGFVSN